MGNEGRLRESKCTYFSKWALFKIFNLQLKFSQINNLVSDIPNSPLIKISKLKQSTL